MTNQLFLQLFLLLLNKMDFILIEFLQIHTFLQQISDLYPCVTLDNLFQFLYLFFLHIDQTFDFLQLVNQSHVFALLFDLLTLGLVAFISNNVHLFFLGLQLPLYPFHSHKQLAFRFGGCLTSLVLLSQFQDLHVLSFIF